MNVITRGMRGALRSPIRSGAILLMLAASTGLVLAMLVARSSVEAKINEVKATTATQLTIHPAGFGEGFGGGGDALTTDQVNTIKNTVHIASVTASLADQLGETDTNLQPSLELGNLGKRVMRFEGKAGGPTHITSDGDAQQPLPKPRTMITGTTQPGSMLAGTALTSGEMIDGNSSEYTALVGKKLADKNNLHAGSTFTAYGKTITVKGIYSTGNEFTDSGLTIPLATLQSLTNQPNAISTISATVDSSDNVEATVNELKNKLGDKADIISQLEQAKNGLKPLEGIAGLALAGVIGAAIASAAIILLSMIIVVRERRREIGVIKAIGGTNIKVIVQFITEGLTLTILGSIIGIALGIAVSGPLTQSLVTNSETKGMGEGKGSHAVMFAGPGAALSQLQTNTKTVTATLTPQSIVASVGIVVLIAIVGSAVPAWAIARIRPAEVLRTE
jgi:putative ABC transport system permease protein